MWWRPSRRRNSHSVGQPRRLKRWPLGLEVLEDRVLLASALWDGGGDGISWTDRFNWGSDQTPGSNDDVTIGTAFAGVTITHASGTTQLNKLTSAAALNITGGSFTFSSTSQIDRELTVSGGSLFVSGTLSGTGILTNR